MSTADSLVIPMQKALTAWTSFLPQLTDYQKRNGFADFQNLGFPGLTPDEITTILTDMKTGVDEFLPVIDEDPWFGGTAQEILSDDKYGQFTSALVLDETNQYGPFVAALPKLKEIRSIIIRNGYGWILSPKLKTVSQDAERAIQRAIHSLRKQGKEAAESASRAQAARQESEAVFTTVKGQVDELRNIHASAIQLQVQLGDAATIMATAGKTADENLRAIQNVKIDSEKIDQELKTLGPQTIAALKTNLVEISDVAEKAKQQQTSAESAAATAASAASEAEKAKGLAQGASGEAASTLALAATAKDEAVLHRDVAKKASTEAEQLIAKLPSTFKELEVLRKQAQEVVDKAEHAWGLANRRGLAKAFDDAAKGYRDATFMWIAIFSMAVFAVCWIALDKIIPLVADGKLLDLKSIVLTLLSGPILWGAWIASREISKNGQMRDEYRYKASVAMALEGYKREAGEVDPALVVKLMEGAVHHFAENPAIRVHRSNAPATPVHDVIERLMGNGENVESAVELPKMAQSIQLVKPAMSAEPMQTAAASAQAVVAPVQSAVPKA